MSFELNLAHMSISDLLEKAAEKNEFIFVRQGQRRLGKTTALMEFARENGYPVLVNKAIVKIFHRKYPDVNIIGYVDGSEVDGLYNVVCDEGLPVDVVKRLHKLGVLLTGFVREEPDSLSAIREAVNYVGYKYGGTVLLEGGSIPKGDLNNLEAEPLNKSPLLQIELEDIDSVPRVFYKGEKITNRIAIDFEWRTGGADKVGSTYIRIKHGNDPDKALAVETKELAVGERAYE
ncbi:MULTISPECIES: hypothetical protein [Bacillus]|mgnify:FL=1|uniref:ATP-binding protein n=3 Tax=Bacillus TaxID=1386 RepID=A0ABN5ANY3_9BACI|nr:MULTISPECIES: hypothetical protein [Bacillus]ASB90844.1 hypothetical protein S101395_04342 [Bacillus sonorensis]MEC0340062.1 hypothetical protein [Bacillus sonorensis]MEC0425739.1 hypothetical protein [Bacillus sonorensis]MEC0458598.1 hypothetical protein [Bacillus sonorensis]MEC0528175.1 hypothetical protein [Bacillus sonorensis]